MAAVEPTYIALTPAGSLLLDAYRSVSALGWQLAKLAEDVLSEQQADEIEESTIGLEKVEGSLARAFCAELLQVEGATV